MSTPRRSSTREAAGIEFLAPNDAAFGASGTADFVGLAGHDVAEFGDADAPRSAWLGALAGVVVTALVVGGVIAAAPWSSGPDGAPPATTAPSTSIVPTTTPATTAGEPTLSEQLGGAPVDPVGWVLDDTGTELAFAGAYSDPNASSSRGPDEDRIDLWATPGATRTTGRWMAISSMIGQAGYEPLVADAIRLDVAGGPALLTAAGDATFSLLFTGADGTPYEIVGFGLTLDELVHVAGTVTMDHSTIVYGGLDAPGGPLDPLDQLISTSSPWGGLGGAFGGFAEASSDYYDSRAERFVFVQRGPVTPGTDVLASFVLSGGGMSNLGPGGSMTIVTTAGDARTIAVGVLSNAPGGSPQSVVRFVEDGQQITLLGWGTSLSALVELASRVHQATSEEWTRLVIESQQAFNVGSPNSTVTQLGGGTLADGRAWQSTGDGKWLQIYGEHFGSQVRLTDRPMPDLRVYSTPTASFVVATSAWPGTAVTLRVTVHDQAPVEVPLVEVGDTRRLMAVHGFSETGAFGAELLDADGTVVAAA
ncbi:MAG: hypothetical protein AAB131_15610 [Actinomycetota bacterium]